MADQDYMNYLDRRKHKNRIPRDKYDGLLFLSITLAIGMVLYNSCNEMSKDKTLLREYNSNQEYIRTNNMRYSTNQSPNGVWK